MRHRRMGATVSNLLAAINAFGKEQPKRPSGKGWKTIGEVAKQEGVSRGTIRYRMQLAIDHGLKVERFVGSDYDASGKLTKQTWFRVQR